MKAVTLSIALVLSMSSAVYFYSSGGAGSEDLKSINAKLSSQVEELQKENERLLSVRKKAEAKVEQLLTWP